MRDATTRAERFAHRYDDNVAPINREIVDPLRKVPGREATPYVDPATGGINARLLLLLSDPGPMAAGNEAASGMLSWDNDDDTAAMCRNLFARAGISWSNCVPWNVVPWPKRTLSAADWREGISLLPELLLRVPHIEVVLPLGIQVGRAWDKLIGQHPSLGELEDPRGPHPSKRGLTFNPNGERQSRDVGIQQLEAVFASAAALL
jgi:hypothetical protein